MRILLTNHALAARGGSELYVRDISLALLRHGHDPIACSRRLGEVATELRLATVSVVDDPGALSTPPDLIHAQHHLEAMTALTRFPDVPAIYVCHGWQPGEEAPPRHPRILRYVAVDDLVRRRLVDECGIPPERVEVHLNFVDLRRFARRQPLPERPRRALVFSNQISEAHGLPELRQACESQGLHLDTLGRRMGTADAKPEDVLGGYDVVFAKARAAMEAAAVGCAVVLCDEAGLGPMVTAAELDRLRGLNFGVRLLRDAITVDGLQDRLDQYDSYDAAEVTRRMRDEAGIEHAVDRLLKLYRDVLSEHAATRYDRAEQDRAVSHYLRHGPLTGGDHFQQERAAFQAELTRAGDWAHSLADQLQSARDDQEALRAEIGRTQEALQDRQREIERLSEALRSHERDTEELLSHAAERLRLAEERLAESDDISTRRQAHLAYAEERLEALDAEIEHLHRNAESASRALQESRQELDWVKNSRTWRWRRHLVKLARLVQLDRAPRRKS